MLVHLLVANAVANNSQIFLIDDSTSMGPCWDDVVDLLNILAYVVKGADPDGLDLSFTVSRDTCNSKRTTKLVDFTKARCPATDQHRPSNICVALNKIFDDYYQRLHRSQQSARHVHLLSKRPRQANLYIFTDGVWQPDIDVEAPIKAFVKILHELGMPREQFGIQLIQFGQSTIGTARLRRLDSGMDIPM